MNRFRYKPWLSPLLGSEDLLLLFFPFLPLLSFLQPSEQFWIPCFGELEGEAAQRSLPQTGQRLWGRAFCPPQFRPLGSRDEQRGEPITALLAAFQRQSSLFPMATCNNKLTPFLDKEISRRNLCSITCSVCCISGRSAHRYWSDSSTMAQKPFLSVFQRGGESIHCLV